MSFSSYSVAQLERLLTASGLSISEIESLRQDERRGVQTIIRRWDRQQREQQRLLLLQHYERELRSQGYQYIAGLDEAGRGPLAGPVVVAAVILPPDYLLPGLDDSKKIAPKKRQELYAAICRDAVAVTSVIVPVEQIDALNIYQATVWGMKQAVANLSPAPEALLIDAVPLPEVPLPQQALIKGDSLSASIAAASIVAKVERDAIMEDLDRQYPGYGFSGHKGYGTAEHLAALAQLGPAPVHRKSFEPIKSMG